MIVHVSPLTKSPASRTKTLLKCADVEPSLATTSFTGVNVVGSSFV